MGQTWPFYKIYIVFYRLFMEAFGQKDKVAEWSRRKTANRMNSTCVRCEPHPSHPSGEFFLLFWFDKIGLPLITLRYKVASLQI